ncbi:MAG: sensor histidine kinase [Labilithrix sp.]|nr:sensor histidine kinase [Labilithrix sp.]MCW5813606.1 sensor histidine kinase [Labilithrix sp.]
MSKGRLTRNELSWLLTQEAQNAAERLRVGVTFLRTQAPPPPSAAEDPAHGVETSLDALDDVMKMLSNLNQRAPAGAAGQAAPQGRRGRIDLAALLMEAAPDARVSIEPGSGTEVYGDEADIRRMLQVLVGHGHGDGTQVNIRRDGDEVKVSVTLGPDLSPTAETERAWLSRVIIRYGGRHELEGGNEVLVFPAESASDRNESAALRKELDEARKQGEVYARELAAVFDKGEEVTAFSSMPPAPGGSAIERFEAMTKLCSGIASELRSVLGPAGRELGSMRRHEITDEQLDTLRRRVSHAQEIVATLGGVGELRTDELETEIDLGEAARAAARALGGLAEKAGARVNVTVKPEGGHVTVRRGARAIEVILRELVAHALEASPRGAVVEVAVTASENGSGVRLVVDDAGSPLPASGRRGFMTLETHAGTYGRPSALPVFLAAELAACQRASLELSDPPATRGDGSGLRVAVTFADG